jgi:hypothetical protein
MIIFWIQLNTTCASLNVDTGNLFDDIVDSRHPEADFFSEPWMYRLKESSPYSGSTSLRHFLHPIPEPQVTKPELLQENKNNIVGNKTLLC